LADEDTVIPAPMGRGSSRYPAADSGALEPDPEDPALLERFQTWYREARDHSHDWRVEARESFDFVAGNQWSPEDAAFLKLSLRPIITFNRIAPVVDSVSGLEVNNRQETRYIPRLLGQAGVNDLLSGAAKWVRDECDAEDEETDAFIDCVTCGMGWTETRLDYDNDPNGTVLIDRLDPMEMYWDPLSRQKNLGDARFEMRVREMALESAEELFPDADTEELNATWAADTGAAAHEPHDAQQAPFYRNDQSDQIDRQTFRVKLVEVQWWDYEHVWRIIDPFTKREVTLSEAEYAKLDSRLERMGLPEPMGLKQRRKRYYKAFVGAKILKVSPGAERGGFTWKAITAKRDRNKGTWYGLVRAMIDPQKWANKWLSQILHIINSNAKGGVMAERDAFENPREAEDTWSSPDAITWLSPGALGGATQAPKIKEKGAMQLPDGIQFLLQFAISSVRDTTGVNLELMGLADRMQAGVLEAHRKESGMTILAGLFASLRKYRKEQGRTMLWFIQNFISDGRLIRIGGQEEAQYVPLVRQPSTAEYDVIVDEQPTSPNLKEKAWEALTQVMPFLARAPIPPQVWLELIDVMPLPETIIARIKQAVARAQQQPPQPNPQLIAAQGKAMLDQAKAMREKVLARVDMGKAQREQALAALDVAQAQLEASDASAGVELKRSQAIAALAKAGITQPGHDLEVARLLVDLVGMHMDNQSRMREQQAAAMQPQPGAQAA
jgi:hypothetical protein